MPRFVRVLQILIAIIVGGYTGFEIIRFGVSIFSQPLGTFVTMTIVLALFLELALFVIYKMIEED
ncbi:MULTISPECIES: hypothetical protein [Vibrio]|uniref:DUF3955 domain-containing protein n=1 Tax=Vibrio algicola TaxID=2662262 RepID=A0A5Q0TCI8_9VIBR|nr:MULTISPECIES: hypothetical protein [Vibrio]MBD1577001.1 hypothetical protein [Vibrio sp. S11_S32]